MLPAFGGSGNLLMDQELMGGAAPGAPAFLGSSAAGAGGAADPGFFVEPESPAGAAAATLGRQPFSPGGRRGSGLGATGLGSGGFGSGAWMLGASGSLAPGNSRDLLRELECHEDLFLPSAPTANPPTSAAPTNGVTVVVPPAPQLGGTGTSPPTPPTLPSNLRWHEALGAFPPLPPSAVPPPQPLQTQLPANGSAGYGLPAAPLHAQLARPQPPALFVAPPAAPVAPSAAPAPILPPPPPNIYAAPVVTLPSATLPAAAPLTTAAPAAAGPTGGASPAPSGSTSSVAAGGSLVSADNVPRIASLPNLHLHLQHRAADSQPKPKKRSKAAAKGGEGGGRGGSWGAKEKMLPRARSHNDLAGSGEAPRAPTPAPGTSTAEVDAAPPSAGRFSVPHLPYLVPSHMRKGKGGRQPAPDPRLDPRIDPKKARRIMANRLSAAKSKLKNKSAKQVQSQRAEVLRLRRDELAAEVEEEAAAVAQEEAERAELRRQVQALEQQVAAQRLQHSPFETGRGWLM